MWHASSRICLSYMWCLVDVRPDSFICDMICQYVTWLVNIWHASFISNMSVWSMCDTADKCSSAKRLIYMWHDSFICDMTHWYVACLIDMWYDLLICDTAEWYSEVKRLIYMRHDSYKCDMTHSSVTWLNHLRHNSFMRDMTHSYATWRREGWGYGVATVSRIDKIIGLFCRISSVL